MTCGAIRDRRCDSRLAQRSGADNRHFPCLSAAVNDLYTCVRMHFLNSSTLADLGDDPRVPNNLVR